MKRVCELQPGDTFRFQPVSAWLMVLKIRDGKLYFNYHGRKYMGIDSRHCVSAKSQQKVEVRL